jgi:hypothetical protein
VDDRGVYEVQELTGLRVLAVHGTDGLGVPVPAWQEGVSTALKAPLTLGERVRQRRKLANKAKREDKNRVIENWFKGRRSSAAISSA